MSGLDVEALLEASESNKPKQPDHQNSVPSSSPKPERNGGGSVKSSTSRRDRDGDRDRDHRGDDRSPRSERHRERRSSRDSER
jgi:hypothetical protein